MSLGFRIRARLKEPCLNSDAIYTQIQQWIHHRCDDLNPQFERGILDDIPTLFVRLHPAAENLELTLLDSNSLVASANTTTVGPGYHVFLCSLLKDWAGAFHASWLTPEDASDDFSDETGFFFTGDESILRDEMTLWLKALANSFFDGSLSETEGDELSDIALCMPMDRQFESGATSITPTGPRSLEWLRKTSLDGYNGKDFFAWWNTGFDASYYLGRAITQMWSDVRWRTPAGEKEKQVFTDVLRCLRRAYELDPTLDYPWAEWAEILTFIGDSSEQLDSVRSRIVKEPVIGYRRGNVAVMLPGGWSMQIPGSFSEFEMEGEGDFVAVDPPREIWFSAFRVKDEGSENAFNTAKQELQEDKPKLFRELDNYATGANIDERRNPDGTIYFVQQSTHIVPGRRALCTVVFHDPDDGAMAEKIWRSVVFAREHVD